MDNVSITNVSLNIPNDKQAQITLVAKTTKPRFIMVGTTDYKDDESIDLLSEIADMTSDEKFAFFTVRNLMAFSPLDKRVIYQVAVNNALTTKSEKTVFSRGYRKLLAKNLMRRVSKGTYMISPKAIIPNDYELEMRTWDSNQPDSI
jgi:hypothetical protein